MNPSKNPTLLVVAIVATILLTGAFTTSLSNLSDNRNLRNPDYCTCAPEPSPSPTNSAADGAKKESAAKAYEEIFTHFYNYPAGEADQINTAVEEYPGFANGYLDTSTLSPTEASTLKVQLGSIDPEFNKIYTGSLTDAQTVAAYLAYERLGTYAKANDIGNGITVTVDPEYVALSTDPETNAVYADVSAGLDVTNGTPDEHLGFNNPMRLIQEGDTWLVYLSGADV